MSSYQLLTLFLIPWIVFDGVLSINRGGSGYYVVKESQEGNEENFVVMKERSLGDSDSTGTYSANWTSLDSRPLPSWYDDAKFGIFIHWGVFSVPSFGSEWFWYNWKENASAKYEQFMKANYPPGFTYQDFAPQFTAEFFDPVNWSKILKASGARYVVLTSKHHEGFTLWPSKHSFSWNSVDTGPHRDLVGDLAAAVRSNTDLKFGLYHSMYEWYNPLYLYDKRNDWKSDLFVRQKTIPELHELVETYKPEVIWSDGDWEAQDAYWTSKEFLAWLYNESPVKDTVVVNDRWGSGIPCKHGDFITCSDRYNPGVLVNKKWENCMTIDRLSWGFRREAPLSDYLTLQRLVRELVVTVSCGGNLLLNVGPTKDGTISPIFEERLREIGNWLHVNGQAIYATKPWKVQNDTLDGNVWYTQSKDGKLIFAAFLQWPKNNTLELGAPLDLTPVSKISFLSYPEHLDTKWEKKNNRVSINLPVEAHKGYPAWVLQIDRTG